MIDRIGYTDVVHCEYENRSNKKRCFVVKTDYDGNVEYRRINGTKYCKSEYSEYNNFKRAWKNCGLHLPFIGRVYKIRKFNSIYPEYAFVLNHVLISDTEKYVLFRNITNEEIKWNQLTVRSFHNSYEFYQ